MTDDTAWVEGDVEVVTERAVGLRVDGEQELVWIPKSQILNGDDEPAVGSWEEYEIPGWLAREKGLD